MSEVMDAIRATGCDAPNPSVYTMPDGSYHCRCLVCGRCERHTGNATQGHFWGFCKVTKTVREGHFCCPDDCELEPKGDAS